MEDIEDHLASHRKSLTGAKNWWNFPPSAFPATATAGFRNSKPFRMSSGLIMPKMQRPGSVRNLHDLRHVVGTALDRTRKKYDLQIKQLKDTEKREKYKISTEKQINTYGYGLDEGAKVFPV